MSVMVWHPRLPRITQHVEKMVDAFNMVPCSSEEDHGQSPLNIGPGEHKELMRLKRDKRSFILDSADKGGGVVLVSRRRWKKDARGQVEQSDAYAPIINW